MGQLLVKLLTRVRDSIYSTSPTHALQRVRRGGRSAQREYPKSQGYAAGLIGPHPHKGTRGHTG